MKKLFVVIISMLLIFSLCACGANKNHNADSLTENSNISELADEEELEESAGQNSTKDTKNDGNNYRDFLDAWTEFSDYVSDNSPKDENIAQYRDMVLDTEVGIDDYMRPLFYWGETLDDNELLAKDALINMFTRGGERYRSMDLQRESNNRYTMTVETNEGEQILIKVDYYPEKDAVHLLAENNGEQALLFECVNITGGYAAQYYYNAVVGRTYGALKKAMCTYRIIFSGTDGSAARFDDAEEPASIIDGVPGEQEFIAGATHWLTVKNGEFTGELNGFGF